MRLLVRTVLSRSSTFLVPRQPNSCPCHHATINNNNNNNNILHTSYRGLNIRAVRGATQIREVVDLPDNTNIASAVINNSTEVAPSTTNVIGSVQDVVKMYKSIENAVNLHTAEILRLNKPMEAIAFAQELVENDVPLSSSMYSFLLQELNSLLGSCSIPDMDRKFIAFVEFMDRKGYKANVEQCFEILGIAGSVGSNELARKCFDRLRVEDGFEARDGDLHNHLLRSYFSNMNFCNDAANCSRVLECFDEMVSGGSQPSPDVMKRLIDYLVECGAVEEAEMRVLKMQKDRGTYLTYLDKEVLRKPPTSPAVENNGTKIKSSEKKKVKKSSETGESKSITVGKTPAVQNNGTKTKSSEKINVKKISKTVGKPKPSTDSNDTKISGAIKNEQVKNESTKPTSTETKETKISLHNQYIVDELLKNYVTSEVVKKIDHLKKTKYVGVEKVINMTIQKLKELKQNEDIVSLTPALIEQAKVIVHPSVYTETLRAHFMLIKQATDTSEHLLRFHSFILLMQKHGYKLGLDQHFVILKIASWIGNVALAQVSFDQIKTNKKFRKTTNYALLLETYLKEGELSGDFNHWDMVLSCFNECGSRDKRMITRFVNYSLKCERTEDARGALQKLVDSDNHLKYLNGELTERDKEGGVTINENSNFSEDS